MSEPQLVAIVNSFNRLALLAEALPALVRAFADQALAGAIVVFEAGSTDGSREWLLRFCADCPLPCLLLFAEPGEDTSFSAGANAACQLAIESFPGAPYLLFYETDNWLASGQPLSEAIALLAAQEKLAGVGFTVRKHSGEPAGYGCRFPTVAQLILGQQLTYRLGLEIDRQPAVRQLGGSRWWPMDVVYTSPLLVRSRAWQASGGLDADTFPFSDCDIDWAWRLARLGWGFGVLACDAVVHDNREQLSQWSLRRVVDFHRARLKLLRRHRGEWVGLVRPLLLVRHGLELVGLALLGMRRPDWRLALAKRWALLRSVLHDYEGATP